MARAGDQIRRGLNNRSQWGCHCLLFWCVHCDEAENVPCSLTYRLLLIYSSVAHLPCHPPHMTRFEKRKERDKRELSHRERMWSLLKLDSDNIFWKETEWKWTNWGRGCLTPPQLVRRLWNGDYDVRGNERDKNTGGSKRLLITVLRKKERRGEGRKQTRVIVANRVIRLWCVSGIHNVFLSFMTFRAHMMAEDYICQLGRGLWKRYANLAKEQKNNIKYVPSNSHRTFKS